MERFESSSQISSFLPSTCPPVARLPSIHRRILLLEIGFDGKIHSPVRKAGMYVMFVCSPRPTLSSKKSKSTRPSSFPKAEAASMGCATTIKPNLAIPKLIKRSHRRLKWKREYLAIWKSRRRCTNFGCWTLRLAHSRSISTSGNFQVLPVSCRA